ncbi:hypothetical protein MTIM_19840 [Mycobacterium timonense]|uniref:Uncharacterized protein n=1 Tax=Mycobacterium timonense TaxID=701043 RepID=A0A7I9Z5F7_9MYCO|nr:hypothetical protein MTIM_19840 [Mycobacterium timonense]
MAGVVGCDFVTGRTGSGAIFTIGGAGGGAGAVDVLVGGGLDGAGWGAWWQPPVSVTSRPMDPSQATALLTRTRRRLIATHFTQVLAEHSELLHRSFFGAAGHFPSEALTRPAEAILYGHYEYRVGSRS